MASQIAVGLSIEQEGRHEEKADELLSPGEDLRAPETGSSGSAPPGSSDVHRLGNLVAVIIAEAQLIQAEYGPETSAHQSALAIERAAREIERSIGLSSPNGTWREGDDP